MADEMKLNTEAVLDAPECAYDDAAEQEKFLAARKAQIEEDT